MSRRTKIIIVIAFLLLFLAFIYWLLIRPNLPSPGGTTIPTNTNTGQTSPVSLPAINTNQPAAEIKIPDEDKIKTDLSRLAAAFAERFGSYSNQGNFENILDLKAIMTPALQQWADNFIKKNGTTASGASAYSGVTTKAISTAISSFDKGAGSAKIVVGTQKIETSGNLGGNQKVYYQDLELIFKKIGDEWKVDEATWGQAR